MRADGHDGLQSLSLRQAISCTNPKMCDANPRRKASQDGGTQRARQRDEEGCLLHSQHSLFCGFVQRQRGNKTRNVCLHVCSCRQIETSLFVAEITNHLQT